MLVTLTLPSPSPSPSPSSSPSPTPSPSPAPSPSRQPPRSPSPSTRPHTNRLVQVGRRVAARASRDARRAQPPRAPCRLGGRRLLGELTSVLPSAAEPATCASGTARHELLGLRSRRPFRPPWIPQFRLGASPKHGHPPARLVITAFWPFRRVQHDHARSGAEASTGLETRPFFHVSRRPRALDTFPFPAPGVITFFYYSSGHEWPAPRAAGGGGPRGGARSAAAHTPRLASTFKGRTHTFCVCTPPGEVDCAVDLFIGIGVVMI